MNCTKPQSVLSRTLAGQGAGGKLSATDSFRNGDVVAGSSVLDQDVRRGRGDDICRPAVATNGPVKGCSDGGRLSLLDGGRAGGCNGSKEGSDGSDGELHLDVCW